MAFLIGQMIDISVYHFMRYVPHLLFFVSSLIFFYRTRTRGKHLWLRSTGSTVVSQLVDTFVVSAIAFLLPGKITVKEFVSLSCKSIPSLFSFPFASPSLPLRFPFASPSLPLRFPFASPSLPLRFPFASPSLPLPPSPFPVTPYPLPLTPYPLPLTPSPFPLPPSPFPLPLPFPPLSLIFLLFLFPFFAFKSIVECITNSEIGVSYVYKLIIAILMTPAIYGVHHVLDTYLLGAECAQGLIAKAAALGPEISTEILPKISRASETEVELR